MQGKLSRAAGSLAWAARGGKHREADLPVFAWCAALLLALIAFDAALGARAILTGPYLLAPFAAAFTGARRATLGIAALTLLATLLSGLWNQNSGDAEYWARLGVIALGSGLALIAAKISADRIESSRRLELLDRAASVARPGGSPERMLDALTGLIVPEFADLCAIDLMSADGIARRAALRASGPEAARIELVLGSREPSFPPDLLGEGPTPVPRVFADMSHRDFAELAHDDADLALISDLGLRSAITVPLLARGRCTGAISFCATDPGRRFSDADVRFASLLCDRIALSLDSAGLFNDLESIESRMEAAMGVLEEAVVIHDANGAALYANGAAYRVLRVTAAEGLAGFNLGALRERFELRGEDGRGVLPSWFPAVRVLRGEQPQPEILRATAAQEDLDLWLRIASSEVPRPRGELAYAVTAIEDITELKRSEFDQALLARLGELFTSSLDYEASVRRLTEVLVPALGDWAGIFMPHPDGRIEPIAMTHADPALGEGFDRVLSRFPLSMEDGVGPALALREGTTLLITAIGPVIERLAQDEKHLGLLQGLEVGSAAIIPMRSAGAIVGVLVLANGLGRSPLGAEDARLAEQVAQRGAVALDNARLATERSEIADTLQKSLLAGPLPDMEHWDLAAVYRPAGSENEVGGDFYDAFPFQGGWLVVIGDVTGRGAGAAAVTGQVRHTVRTAASITGDPLAALATVNRSLLAQEDPALCSLAVVALSGDGSGVARIAIAGHPPPLIAGAVGVREAAATGPVLGAFPDASWSVGQFTIQPDEQLFVYTDGVTEAVGPNERFGEERLRACLGGVVGPSGAVTAVTDALEAFCPGIPDDDAAMIAISPHGRDRSPEQTSGFRLIALPT